MVLGRVCETQKPRDYQSLRSQEEKKERNRKKIVCLGREQYDQLSSLPPISVLQLELVAFLQGLRI